MSYLLIAIGGALGSVARFWCSSMVTVAVGGTFPWGTMTVNVIGSCVIGVAMGVIDPAGRWQVAASTREFVSYFLMIGVLGGYTTFSSFSLQTLELLRHHQWWQAGANAVFSVVLCLLAVALGLWMAASVK
jgi:CrcB protein